MNQKSPQAVKAQTKRSPLLGVSTDEHDLSTGHGGSKFENSLMENTVGAKNRIQDSSLMDHGSQDFLGSNQQSLFVPFNQKSSRRPDDHLKSQEKYGDQSNSLLKNKNGVEGNVNNNSASATQFYPEIKNDKKQIKYKKRKNERIALQITRTTIDRIIYPVQTKRGIKYAPKKKQTDYGSMAGFVPKDLLQDAQTLNKKGGKLLDGFLILYSCRVKLPHEAIKSKLDSQNIMEVIEEDLCYFQNLSSIDLSDNHIRFEQLRNLKSLTEVNLQYNYIRVIPSLALDDFERLENLNLSYNSIAPASIRSLYTIKRLKFLDLQANNLVTLPEDIGKFESLEELNLASNQFSSQSSLVNPALLFKAMGQIKRLKRLNLSRNKFTAFHAEMLNMEVDFIQLQELDFGYNLVQEQEALWFIAQMKHINLLIITGNPLALQGKEAYAQLEINLQTALSAVIINDEIQGDRNYLKKIPQKKSMASFPYPNPIKLLSRGEKQKELKGEYLNAEMMHQGIALPISDIKPDNNIQSEIFPPELTREAQNKEVFTPPNHQQMRFVQKDDETYKQDSILQQQEEENAFFITEDVHERPQKFQNIIKEENESENEQLGAQNNYQNQDLNIQQQDDNDQDFDFGRAKMDFFKKRARDILMSEQEMEYEGVPMPLSGAYKTLKHSIKNPAIVYSKIDNKPGYMKMTFSQGRQAPKGSSVIEMGMNGSLTKSVKQINGSQDKGQLNPLLLSLKHKGQVQIGSQNQGENKFLDAIFGAQKVRTKKEIERDKKVEALLEAFKKQDEDLMKKEQEREHTKKINQKALLEKFGFNEDEEDMQLAEAMAS